MKRNLALAISFVIGLAGGIVLFSDETSSVQAAVADPGPAVSQLVMTGEWRISESGVLTWAPTGSTVGAVPDFAWYAERAQALAALRAELESQIDSSRDGSAAAPAAMPAAAGDDENAERTTALEKIAADLECQISYCEP